MAAFLPLPALSWQTQLIAVIACGGDGDGFAIGTAHTIHAMRRNVNITYILMDNHVYGLTKGQTSPHPVMLALKPRPRQAILTPIAALLELALASEQLL